MRLTTTTDKAAALAALATDELAHMPRPTLHDITVAVVRAAPRLGINGDDDAIAAEVQAVQLVCRRANWHGVDIIKLPRTA